MIWNSIWFEQLLQAFDVATWSTLAVVCLLGLVLLVTVFRAERSVANVALTAIALLAVGVAAATALRASNPRSETREARLPPTTAPVPVAALACLDGLAGDAVIAGCEKVLFGAPDVAAAAVSYTAVQINRLTSLGDVAAADRVMTPELQALRRALQRDRYGLVAHVLTSRDSCTPADCFAYQSLTDKSRITTHMDEKLYDGLVSRHAALWDSPPASATPSAATASLPAGSIPAGSSLPVVSGLPAGKPTNAEFPTSASIPPVSIMTPEPVLSAVPQGAAAPAAAAPANRARSSTASSPSAKQAEAPPAARKQAPPPKQRANAPIQIAPVSTSSTAPAAAEE